MGSMRRVRVSTACRTIRRRLGLSATDTAHRAGVSVRTWYFWESGTVQPQGLQLARLKRLTRAVLKRDLIYG